MSDMRIAKKFPFFLILLAVLPAMAGCDRLVRQAFDPPKVDLVDVALESDPTRNPRGPWRFLVTLSVDNRNPYGLEIARFAWTGSIGDSVVTSGDRPEAIRIAPSGVSTVRTSVALDPGALEAAARHVLSRRSVSWAINGSVGLRAPLVGVVPVPFSKSGRYDMAYILKRLGVGLN
jgi:LEA14-like dessication related protein